MLFSVIPAQSNNQTWECIWTHSIYFVSLFQTHFYMYRQENHYMSCISTSYKIRRESECNFNFLFRSQKEQFTFILKCFVFWLHSWIHFPSVLPNCIVNDSLRAGFLNFESTDFTVAYFLFPFFLSFFFRYFGWNCRHDLTAWLLILCRYLFTRMVLASKTMECRLSRKGSAQMIMNVIIGW